MSFFGRSQRRHWARFIRTRRWRSFSFGGGCGRQRIRFWTRVLAGGVFLRAACKRLALLGGEAGANVRGIEINGAIHGRISKKLCEEFGVSDRNLVHEDFFKVKAEAPVDAVVGNPQFIRYQRFTGGAAGAGVAMRG